MANSGEDLDLDSCRRVIDELSRIKVFQVNIGGGEPFLREDIMDILDYCHEKGIVTLISTNATMIDDDTAKRLARMGLTFIQVSLDGAVPESNDRIRGKGSYSRAVKGIEALNRSGFKNLSINTVVTGANYREIPEMYRLGKRYNAKTRLSRFKPSGRGREAWDEYHLTGAQVEELSSTMTQYREELTGDSFFSISAEDRKSLALDLCGAAKMTCCLSPDGNIYPCAVLQNDYFCAGNILKRPFGDIWRDSAVFNDIRKLEVDSCGRCPTFQECHAGCIAIALFLKDQDGYQDPACIRNLF
jgi:mycofactocin radical SAM maturase